MNRHNSHPGFAPARQHGAVVIIVVIGMLVTLSIIGLALDGSHTMVTKTRMQNIADAAALSAAKTLDRTGGDEIAARAEALAMFNDASDDLGHEEINRALNAGDFNVVVEFSNTLVPDFEVGSTPPQYVRVSAMNFALPTALLGVVGQNSTNVGVTAVAGPSVTLGKVCNVVPMMVCGDGSGAENYHGFKPGEITVMKAGSANQEMEKGNFQLVRLDDNTGAADLRNALAGQYDSCIVPEDGVETEPGNTVGPVAQGLNTRLGIYTGPMGGTATQHPADVFTEESQYELTDEWVETDGVGEWVVNYNGEPVVYDAVPDTLAGGDYYEPMVASADGTTAPLPSFYSYEDYLDDSTQSGSESLQTPIAKLYRRRMAIPVASCTNESGQSNLTYEGVMCFFLVQQVAQGSDPDVFGQFTPEPCATPGLPGPVPMAGVGPYRIQLYKDTDGNES